MAKIDGYKQALELLSSLETEQAQKILRAMSEKDPELAQRLENELISLEDIQFITPKMLVELLREIEISDLALSLRLGSENLRAFILEHVSSGIKEDIEHVINGKPVKRSLVEEARMRVMRIVKKKIENKEIIISKNPEELV